MSDKPTPATPVPTPATPATNTATPADFKPAKPRFTALTPREKALRAIKAARAKIKAGQEQEKAALETLAKIDREEAIQTGGAEVLALVSALDPTEREAIIAQLLSTTKDPTRQARVHLWVGQIQPAKTEEKAEVKTEQKTKDGGQEGNSNSVQGKDEKPQTTTGQ